MGFTLLPAVDVADGRVVGIPGGEPGRAGGDGSPMSVALGWQADGAGWVHLVDLDAAFERGSNQELLEAVIGVLDIDVELSAGVRDDTTLSRALATGCQRVIISAAALVDIAWCTRTVAAYADRVAVGLDVRVVEQPDGTRRHRLHARGAPADTGDLGDLGDLWDTLTSLDRAGCARYVVTDITKDGMLRGPNIDLYHDVTSATATPVTASGGITTIDDLHALMTINASLDSAIVGAALHAGRFTLPDALTATRLT